MNLSKLFLTLMLAVASISLGNSKSFKNYNDSLLIEMMISFEYDNAIKYIISKLRSPLDRNSRIYYLCMQSHIGRIINDFDLSDKSALEALSYIDAQSPPDLIELTKIELTFASLLKNDLNLSVEDFPKYEESSNFELKQKIDHLYGIYFSLNGGYKESLPYLQNSFNLLINTPLSHEQTIGALSIAISYLGISKLDSALFYLDFAYKNSIQSNDSLGLIKVLNAKATFNLLFGNNKSEFLDYTKKAIEISERCGFTYLTTIAYVQLMNYYANLNEIYNVLKYAKIAEQKLNGSHHLEINFYTILYNVYSKINDNNKALFYLEKIVESKKNFENQGQSALIAKLNHEKKLKEQEITIIAQQNRLESERNNKTQLIGLNLFFLFIILGYTLYFRKEKQNRQLLFQKEKYTERLILFEKSKYNPSFSPILTDNTQDEDQENRTELFKDFIQLIDGEKLYLDPELKQNTLITMLFTNKKYFYEAISKNSKLNFKQILNYYRTEEAKKLIENFCIEIKSASIPADLHLSSGFNSTSSYHRIFKEIVGLSPKEYAKEFLKTLDKKNT